MNDDMLAKLKAILAEDMLPTGPIVPDSEELASDITSPSLLPDGYVLDSIAETLVSDCNEFDAQVDEIMRAEHERNKLAAELLREVADHIEKNGMKLEPMYGGQLLGVLVTVFEASGWTRDNAVFTFQSIWGIRNGTN